MSHNLLCRAERKRESFNGSINIERGVCSGIYFGDSYEIEIMASRTFQNETKTSTSKQSGIIASELACYFDVQSPFLLHIFV